MEAAGKAHRENLNEMEFRFFKEKVTWMGCDQPGGER